MNKNLNLYVNNSQSTTISGTPKIISISLKTDTIENQYNHFHKYLEVFYFLEGEGVIEYGKNKSRVVHPHDCVVINPYCKHKKYPMNPNGSLTYYVVAINDIKFKNLNQDCISLKDISFLEFNKKNNFVYNALTNIIDELINKNTDYYTKLNAILTCLLIDLHRKLVVYDITVNSDSEISIPKNILDIKSYLETYFANKITLDSLEKNFFISKSHLIKKFNKYYGVSPIQYLTQLKIEKSKVLLLQSNMSISEIAYSLSYDSSSYFSEVFKKLNKISPTEFRKKEWSDSN